MSRFAMLAVVMMLASTSAAVVEESGNCNMACCRGTWTGNACTVSGEILKVKHELHADGQAFHRCYADDNHATNGCICQCADAAGDFNDSNRYNTPESSPEPLYAFGTCMPSGTYTTDECCPAGYNVAGITSESECKTAFESLSSDHWGGNQPRDARPSGCNQYTGNSHGFWNPTNVVGNSLTWGDDKTICKLI